MNTFFIVDLVLLLVLLICVFVWVKAFLTLLNSLSTMISFYLVSAQADSNVRAAQQSSILSGYVFDRNKSIKYILITTLAICVVIFLHYLLLGIPHASI